MPTLGQCHALETEVGDWHVFRFHAGDGSTLGDYFGTRGKYNNPNFDGSIYPRIADGIG